MDDLSKVFGLGEVSSTDKTDLSTDGVDFESTPEETADRIFELRLNVCNVFGQEAMYDHPFYAMALPGHKGKTPYRLACESDEGLNKALEALKQVPR